VRNGYRDLVLPCDEINIPKKFSMKVEWNGSISLWNIWQRQGD